MAFSITVRLRHGRYDAGSGPGGGAEWPPHPARVFCALAASATVAADWDALRWLESQPPPEVWADPLENVRSGRASAYVPENATLSRAAMSGTNAKKSSLQWPARKNGMRSRAFAVPATSSFAITWPEADPPPGVLARLAGLAATVPYVGRSTSLTEVRASAAMPEPEPGWVTYETTALDSPDALDQLRVPYTGYTAALEEAYQQGQRAPDVARSLAYRQVVEAEPDTAIASAAGPFSDLMIWRLTRSSAGLDGGQAVLLAQALRKATMSRVPDPVPAQISGHGAPGLPHVGFLALPDVGHQHADGHVLGLALAVPRALDPADLGRLLKAMLAEPLPGVRLPGGHFAGLEYGADHRYGLRPGRWAGPLGGTREWVTATPLMLDGHLRRGRNEAGEVARSLVLAGYPEPCEVEVSPSPLVAGGVWRPRASTLPPGRPRLPLIHARVTFPVPVIGPVLAGSMRYLGLGLFLPVTMSAFRQAQPEQAEVVAW